MVEEVIRERIRMMIRTGDLPCDDPQRLWVGTSSGKRCAGCLQPIPPHDIEYEAELAGQALYFHRACHRIWLEECADGSVAAR